MKKEFKENAQLIWSDFTCPELPKVKEVKKITSYNGNLGVISICETKKGIAIVLET